MNLAIALRCTLDQDLSAFVQLLQQQQVPCRVSEERGEQVLWVPAELVEPVQQLFHNPDAWAAFAAQAASPVPVERPSFVAQLRQAWLTGLWLVLTAIVALVTGLGERLDVVSWFSLQAFTVHGEYGHFLPLEHTLSSGQWWRLVSPMLLHFSVLHLVFNALWLWELGRRIELQQGRSVYLALVLLAGVLSNLAQYQFSDAPLFGGLSGVVFALLGFCWLYQWRHPVAAYALPKALIGLMLGWLLIGVSGVLSLFDLHIANAAHVGGLAVGCVLGLAAAQWDKHRAPKA